LWHKSCQLYIVHCSPHDLSQHRAGLLPRLCTVRLPYQGPAVSQQDKHALACCQLPPALRLSWCECLSPVHAESCLSTHICPSIICVQFCTVRLPVLTLGLEFGHLMHDLEQGPLPKGVGKSCCGLLARTAMHMPADVHILCFLPRHDSSLCELSSHKDHVSRFPFWFVISKTYFTYISLINRTNMY